MNPRKNPAAVALRAIKSRARSEASRLNGAKGGRPRKDGTKREPLTTAQMARALSVGIAPRTGPAPQFLRDLAIELPRIVELPHAERVWRVAECSRAMVSAADALERRGK